MGTSTRDRDRTLRSGLLARFRARGSPVAAATLVAFTVSTVSPSLARAQAYEPDGDEAAALKEPPSQTAPQDIREAVKAASDDFHTLPEVSAGDREQFAQPADPTSQKGRMTADLGTPGGTPPNSGPATETLDLPTGADKSGVTSQAISIPKGSGKLDGMGESFSAQLSTGIATLSVPFSLPEARGGAQPSLGLDYSSAGGLGLAGMGWSVGVPFVARQTDRGLPAYDDRAAWHPNQDRFAFNGGQELVPICTVGPGGVCSCVEDADGVCRGGAREDERMPPWAENSQYFRARVEGSFLRFFWSADHLTWRVQDKSGVTMELGVPLDGSHDATALERNPDNPAEIYRWNLVRQYDAYGGANPVTATTNPTPVNVVVYKYFQDGGAAYLQDIYDTTPASTPTTSDLQRYAHHTRLAYETRPDRTFSYRSGWRMDQRLRLRRVDVTSKAFNEGVDGLRKLVRRYHLEYDPDSHLSLLSKVEVEGRCAAASNDPNLIVEEIDGQSEDGAGVLAETTGCPRLPPMRFSYSRVAPFTTAGVAGIADLAGYEGFDERVREISGDPERSIDEALSDLFDIDSDSLPDVLVTAPGLYNDDHAVFFNSPGGATDTFSGVQKMSVLGVLGANSNTLKLSNLNVAALDADGDATIDLLHMPKVKTYAIYTPQLQGGLWKWAGREITTAASQSPKIDLGADALDTKVADVNFDGLVDIVVSTGTQLQTFFALGRYAGADGQFGSASWTSATTSEVSTNAITSCVPHSGNPVRFSDPDIRLGDMNGDGILDIVRIRRGDIRYWPGRGNGYWGTGRRNDCLADSFGSDRHLAMDQSPYYSDAEGSSLQIDDVNGDGLDDLVQVRFDAVDIWLNVDGAGWTTRHVIRNTPAAPAYSNRVRLVDVNGSGTRDLLWGDGRKYRYMDLQGGKKPWLLTRIENGLGKSTDIEYTTSTAEMLAAEKHVGACDGEPWASRWCSKMPTVAQVVKRVAESDNLIVAGKPPCVYVTEYSYRDPVFEARQREFRGFRKARVRRIGDENSPTDTAESTFLLGECVDETVGDLDNGIDDCSTPERWRDNPREALKGLPILSERYDEGRVYLTTQATAYRLRRLYVGLDGREVRHAFESVMRTILYDTAAGPSSQSTMDFDTVELEVAEDPAWDPVQDPDSIAAGVRPEHTIAVPIRRIAGHAIVESASAVDFFGNGLVANNRGCIGGPSCSVADERIRSHSEIGFPAGEQTGWLFRVLRSYVTGSLDTTRREEKLITYNAQGEPTQTDVVLTGTVALDRFRTSGTGPVGGSPVGASADGDENDPIFVSRRTYDGLGSLVQEEGANNRCRNIGYDSDAFGMLATLEQIFRNGCGNAPLVVSAMYDRGLGRVTTVFDMQQQSTFVDYDGFGRLREVRPPHPSGDTAKASRLPGVKIEYFLPGTPGVGHSIIQTQTQDGDNPESTAYLRNLTYFDGFGRALVTLAEADTAAGDGAAWVASEFSEYDNKLAPRRKYLPFFTNTDPMAFPIGIQPNTPYGRLRYDAFGRQVQAFDLDGTVSLHSRYHALGTDLYDAADIYPGPHQNTPASSRTDGHGRTIATTERVHVNGTIEEREVQLEYLPTGEPRLIKRVRVGKADPPVIHWMRYDSLGRMVLNVEPNTTGNFNPNPATNPAPSANGLKAWRYAYNDFGDLVGSSDARGCGVNFFYDGAGRLVGEDYSPCESHHAAYTVPTDVSTGAGLEVLYVYDDAVAPNFPTGFTPPPGYPTGAANAARFLVGRLVATFDRASAAFNRYDGRGRVTQRDARIYRTNAAATAPFGGTGTRYTNQWFSKDFAYDAADREVASTTGSTVANLQGAAVTTYSFDGARDNSVVTTTYTRRGTVKNVGGSYQTLVASVDRTADGLIEQVVYGDAASTTTSFSYDNRRRLSSVQTFRAPPPGLWEPPAPGYTPTPSAPGTATSFQLLLQDEEYTYDVASNPIEIRDWRNPAEWPDGAKPVTRKVEYDDLYRVARVGYEHSGGSDTWTDPFAAEAGAEAPDSRRAPPSPRLTFGGRVRWQTFEYDWLGNTAETDDDANGFYDRSLGVITNNGAAQKPYQLKNATNKPGGLGSSGNPTPNGEVQALYDAAGNLVRLDLQRNGNCTGTQCNQRFNYRWDEVARLVRALRWDVAYAPGAALPTDGTASADLSYLYDAADRRVLKVAAPNLHTVYVFESLELRRATLTGTGAAATYSRDDTTEVPYLFANDERLARLVFEGPNDGEPRTTTTLPTGLHVFLELEDHLGSTGAVLDKATSELVERSTYQAFGGADSDYRPDRWQGFREDYRFAGKEEDVEVGLQYFGKRFLSPYLGRWVSPDPLAVHAPGEADPNLYAYVSGQVLRAIDPVGLVAVFTKTVPEPVQRKAEQEGKSVAPRLRSDGSWDYFFWTSKDGSKTFIFDPDGSVFRFFVAKRNELWSKIQKAGKCTGPACTGGGKLTDSDLGDALAQLVGLINLVGVGTEDGSGDGHTLGMCSSCPGGKLQQSAASAIAIVTAILQFAKKNPELIAKGLIKVTGSKQAAQKAWSTFVRHTFSKQTHHFMTNKGKHAFQAKFNQVARKYGLKLDDAWNKADIPHQGRHATEYHEWVSRQVDDIVKEVDKAGGSGKMFTKLFKERVVDPVSGAPDMLTKVYWLIR